MYIGTTLLIGRHTIIIFALVSSTLVVGSICVSSNINIIQHERSGRGTACYAWYYSMDKQLHAVIFCRMELLNHDLTSNVAWLD